MVAVDKVRSPVNPVSSITPRGLMTVSGVRDFKGDQGLLVTCHPSTVVPPVPFQEYASGPRSVNANNPWIRYSDEASRGVGLQRLPDAVHRVRLT